MGGSDSSGGGGGGGRRSYSVPGDHSSSTAWSQSSNYTVSSTPSYHSSSYGSTITPTIASDTCPTSITPQCIDAQQTANNLCDRIGSNEGLGKATPGGDISDGIRCLQAVNDAKNACGE